MARHNVFLLINHLSITFKDLGFSKLKDDADIRKSDHFLAKAFDKCGNVPDEIKSKIYNYLEKRQFLPIIKYFKQKNNDKNEQINFQELSDFLKTAFIELDNLRNSYTHYLAVDKEGKDLSRKINIDNVIVEKIAELFKEAPKYSVLRHFDTQKEDDYEHLDKYELFENKTNTFTHQGFFFFISLFLQKDEAYKFLKRFSGFKDETLPSFKATLKVFSAYSLKIPQIKVVNENLKQSLLVEMISELNKCPKELFEHLIDKDKKEFEPSLDEKSKTNIRLNSINYEEVENIDIQEELKKLSSKKRYGDRFYYFALRYLDETDVFENIRFQIQLGKLTFKKYDKKINGKIQNRNVNKVSDIQILV